jgi:site-specific DNA recombinase
VSKKQQRRKVAFYIRVSSFEQNVEGSVGGQRDALTAVAAAMDLDFYKEYVDEGISGLKDSRGNFQLMMKEGLQKPRLFDVLLIWDQSRLSRKNTTAMTAIEKLEENGVEVREVREAPPEDPKTRKLVRAIRGGVNEYQMDVMSEDIARGQRRAAREGYWQSPTIPYGYQREYVYVGPRRRSKLVINSDEQPHVQLVWDLGLKDMSPSRIVRWLHENGHFKADGTRWKLSHVRKILSNPVYFGMFIRGLRSKKTMAVPVTYQRNACEPIVSEEEFQQVQELKALRTFERRHPRNSASPYPLSGLLACESHNANLNMEGAKNRKGGKYTCSAIRQEQQKDCTTPRLPAEDIHARVTQCVTDRILTDDNITAIAAEIKQDRGGGDKDQELELKSTREQIASTNQRKNNLVKKVMEGQFMDSDITEQMNGIRSTLELLEQREEELNANLANQSTFFTDLDRIKTYARDLKTYLREGNEDTLKLIFHLVVDKIIVRPGSATIRYTIPMPPDGTGDWR